MFINVPYNLKWILLPPDFMNGLSKLSNERESIAFDEMNRGLE
jgi:hypothetical protein